jgi:hypothetical protein
MPHRHIRISRTNFAQRCYPGISTQRGAAMPFPLFLHKRRPFRAPSSGAPALGSPGAGRPRGGFYERWRKEALIAEANERAVEGYERMSKGELIAALRIATRLDRPRRP